MPIVSFCSLKISFPNTCIVLIFFIAGLLFCALSTSFIGSVSHPAGDRPSHPIWLVGLPDEWFKGMRSRFRRGGGAGSVVFPRPNPQTVPCGRGISKRGERTCWRLNLLLRFRRTVPSASGCKDLFKG